MADRDGGWCEEGSGTGPGSTSAPDRLRGANDEDPIGRAVFATLVNGGEDFATDVATFETGVAATLCY